MRTPIFSLLYKSNNEGVRLMSRDWCLTSAEMYTMWEFLTEREANCILGKNQRIREKDNIRKGE